MPSGEFVRTKIRVRNDLENCGFSEVASSSGPPDISVLAVAFLLTCIGITMVFSASGYLSYQRLQDNTYFLKKEVLWAVISLIFMLIAANFDYRYLRKFAIPILAVSAVTLILVLIPGLGVKIKGARRWLDLGFVEIHPGEFAKLAIVIFYAGLLAEIRKKIRDWRYFAGAGSLVVLFGVLIMLQPDFGMVVMLGTIAIAMMVIGGARFSHLLAIGVIAIPTAWLLIMSEPYRRDRILGFLNPEADPQGIGFHSIQSMIAIVSGGITGRGLGMSGQKRFFLPEQHTDFIFSVFAEEFGMIGIVVLIGLFLYLAYRGFVIAISCDDRFGFYLAFGITFSIVFQAFVNMGVAVGLLPVTGLTLPFVSFGGSSLLSTYIGIGILLNISMRNHAQKRKKTTFGGVGMWGNGGAYLSRRSGRRGDKKKICGN